MDSNGNVNQQGYERRLEVVRRILQDHGLSPASIETLAYDVRCPFHFNNFIYKATFTSPLSATQESSKLLGKQPGTFPLPDGASALVVRLSNPCAEGLNNANRVENEVASQYLARQALERDGRALVVPAVYAWGPCCYFQDKPDETGFGWTIVEFKQGSELDGAFPSFSQEEKISVIQQIADLFGSIQSAKLPDSVTQFGALTFDKSGQIIMGEPPLLISGGPWDTYSSLWTAKLKAQLLDADKSPLLDGWKDTSSNSIRDRLESFLANDGVSHILEGNDPDEKVLIHGDLTMNNMLYDTEQKKVTAILDFDWASITNPCDEFLGGFWDLGMGIHEDNASFQTCIITGDFSNCPEGIPAEDIGKWETGKVLSAALAQRGASRPSTIKAAAAIQRLRELESMLCPFSLSNEVMLRRKSQEAKLESKAQKGQDILKWLASAGF